MPNTGHIWTEEEESDAVALDWAQFTALYPTITRDAYRIRRQTIRREQPVSECWVCRFLKRLHSHA